jgi:hypothetical protein
MRKTTKRAAILICLLLLAVFWWWHSWNFEDRFVVGEYVAKTEGECNVLELNSDHTFNQKVSKGDRLTVPAAGTWRRFGEAGVAFSNSFIGATPDAFTNNNVYAMLDNTFGFHSLTVDPQTKPLTFHKRLLHLRACSW